MKTGFRLSRGFNSFDLCAITVTAVIVVAMRGRKG